MLTYLIILSTSVAGMMQAHWWAAVVGGCVLALRSLAERGYAFTGAPSSTTTTQSEMSDAAAFALLSGTLAAGLAFATGRMTAWLWGLY